MEVFIATRKGEWLLGAPSGSRPLPANLQAVNADEDYLVATQKIVTKVPADGLGWTVVVREDLRYAFAPIDEVRRLMLAFTALVAGLFDFTTHASDASIVRTVIALGHGLGLEVIAEGVETATQQSLLQVYGCTSYQGYLYGRPAPIEQFEAEMAQWST